MDLFGGLGLLWQVATRVLDRPCVQVELLTALGEYDLASPPPVLAKSGASIVTGCSSESAPAKRFP